VASGRILTDPRDIRTLLKSAATIAVLGLSPKPGRDSYRVAAYLKDQGYRIIPVRPAQKEILGEPAYDSLTAIPFPVDIVDAFRNPADILKHTPEVLAIRPRAFWMQLGIENHEAAGILTQAGIDVIMNRCIKIDHDSLIRKQIIL